jgi:ribonuclease T2
MLSKRLLAIAIAGAMALGTAAPRSRSRNRGAGTPGVFDYYVLSLSWSPEYCAINGSNDPEQCADGRKFAFVVHGLWPQYERGYPQNCAAGGAVSDAIIRRMLPLMPSPKLIEHEWRTHGTCSGLNQDAYFDLVRRAYSQVSIPADFKAPIKNIEVTPAQVKNEFVRANSAMPADAFRVLCRGRFLSEVRVCLTKQLQGRACSPDVRDACAADEIIMRPVR